MFGTEISYESSINTESTKTTSNKLRWTDSSIFQNPSKSWNTNHQTLRTTKVSSFFIPKEICKSQQNSKLSYIFVIGVFFLFLFGVTKNCLITSRQKCYELQAVFFLCPPPDTLMAMIKAPPLEIPIASGEWNLYRTGGFLRSSKWPRSFEGVRIGCKKLVFFVGFHVVGVDLEYWSYFNSWLEKNWWW